MTKSVLITGGSGLLGTALTDLLLQKGYHVSHLARNPSNKQVKTHRWSISEAYIDPNALEGVDAIIHLAGAGVTEKRWTVERKKEILESRTKSSELIFRTLKNTPNQIRSVISANGIGYYGFETGDNWCVEDFPNGQDFLAKVTSEWASSMTPIETLGVRLAILRIGIVLSNKGGALTEIARPVKWFAGAPLGNGNQWMSWIHIHDMCRMVLFFLENEISGTFNATAPNPVTNRDFTKFIAHALARPLFLPPVPEFAMKMILGEMAQIVVTGARVSCDKIKSTGFQFDFTDAEVAIKNLLKP